MNTRTRLLNKHAPLHPQEVIDACMTMLNHKLTWREIRSDKHVYAMERALIAGALVALCGLSGPEVAVQFGRRFNSTYEWQRGFASLPQFMRDEWIEFVSIKALHARTIKARKTA